MGLKETEEAMRAARTGECESDSLLDAAIAHSVQLEAQLDEWRNSAIRDAHLLTVAHEKEFRLESALAEVREENEWLRRAVPLIDLEKSGEPTPLLLELAEKYRRSDDSGRVERVAMALCAEPITDDCTEEEYMAELCPCERYMAAARQLLAVADEG